MNMDEDKAKKTTLGPPPDNDYGRVRDRRDFKPLDVRLKPILPCPFRDFTFTCLTGWRYHPTAPSLDRLGSNKGFEEKLSTDMVIPDSWKDEQEDVVMENTRKQLEGWEPNDSSTKRQRLDEASQSVAASSSATVVTNSTSGSSSSISQQPNDRALQQPIPRKAATATIVPLTNAPSSSTNFVFDKGAANTVSSNIAAPTTVNPTPGIVPKAALYVFYGKKPRRVQLSGSDYVTWDNGSRTHELKYTSIFICPLTKECFLAGRYGDVYFPDGNLVWYTKKALAEHAAAARAWDCWNLRDQVRNAERMGLDEPYWKGQQPVLPTNLFPAKVMEAIQKAQDSQSAQQTSTTPPPPSHTPPPASTQAPAAQYNQDKSQGGDRVLPSGQPKKDSSHSEHSRDTEKRRADYRPQQQPRRSSGNNKSRGRGNNTYPSNLPPRSRQAPPPPPPPGMSPWQRDQHQYVQQRRGGSAGSGYADKSGGLGDTSAGYRDSGSGHVDNIGGFGDNSGGYRGSGSKGGGYGDNGGGYSRDNNGGYGGSSGGYRDNSGGHVDKGGGYRDNSSGYGDNNSGYRDNSSGYGDNSGGYGNNGDGYQQGGDSSNAPQPSRNSDQRGYHIK